MPGLFGVTVTLPYFFYFLFFIFYFLAFCFLFLFFVFCFLFFFNPDMTATLGSA